MAVTPWPAAGTDASGGGRKIVDNGHNSKRYHARRKGRGDRRQRRRSNEEFDKFEIIVGDRCSQPDEKRIKGLGEMENKVEHLHLAALTRTPKA